MPAERDDEDSSEKLDPEDIVKFVGQMFQNFQRSSHGGQPSPDGQTPPDGQPQLHDRSNTIDNDKLVLEELRKGYDRDIGLRKDLEGKANTIITFCGVILTLLLGFITLYFSRVNIDESNLLILKYFIIAIIIAILSSLILALLAVKLGRNLDTALIIGKFLKMDGKINWAEINTWRS